jgi:hypothetical protein
MRQYTIILLFLAFSLPCLAQKSSNPGTDFGKYMATAKTSYKGNDLEDTHYQLLLSLQQLDMKVGEEILKIMPENMDSLKALKDKDHVNAASGTFIGTSIHREYGSKSNMEVDIISNSPMVGALNAWLNNPMLAGASGKKAMKVDGYKGSYTYEMRDQYDDAGKSSKVGVGEMQIPIYSSLVTIKSKGISEDAFVKLMNTIPVSRIANMLK